MDGCTTNILCQRKSFVCPQEHEISFLAELNSFGAPKIIVHAAMTLQKELLLIDRLSFLVPRREMFGVKADASVTGRDVTFENVR